MSVRSPDITGHLPPCPTARVPNCPPNHLSPASTPYVIHACRHKDADHMYMDATLHREAMHIQNSAAGGVPGQRSLLFCARTIARSVEHTSPQIRLLHFESPDRSSPPSPPLSFRSSPPPCPARVSSRSPSSTLARVLAAAVPASPVFSASSTWRATRFNPSAYVRGYEF